MENISLKQFIAHFGNDLRREKRFCFILGAGASKSSGIPTGWDLVQQWVEELKEIDEEDFSKWRDEKGISEENYASHYSEIFDKRFEFSKKDGFAFLQKTMENKEPSCGYSVLAQILAGGNHNIVITTNFDSLTEDALFIYTKKKPLVIGHASLANYISANLSRPIIIKIHHDLLLSPKNGENEVACLDENYSKNMKDVFKYYTPLVIGYGGNDGSLMNFLDKLDHFEEGLFWFYMDGNEPKKEIKDFVSKVNGHFVPVKGFDDLMIQLGDALKLDKLDSEIEKIAKDRADNYRKQIEEITDRKTTDNVTKEAMTNIAGRGKKTWWNYELLARKESEDEKINEIYLQGINEFPKSSELLGNYALFLHEIRKRYDEAEEFYLKALEINPEEVIYNGNYANFLFYIRKQYDKAEKYYLKALEIDPEDDAYNGNYANLLSNIWKRYDEAEKYYLKAIEVEPGNSINICNYAIFQNKIRRQYDTAENYYIKALEIEPENAYNNAHYALFLHEIRKRYDEAEKYYLKALEIDPENETSNGDYAYFLSDIRKRFDDAENYFIKSLKIEPKNISNNGNYANFLTNIGKRYDEAEKCYLNILVIEPENASLNCSYANFLSDIRKQYDEAEKYYLKALKVEPEDANLNGNYAKHLIICNKKDASIQFIKEAFKLNKGIENSLLLELWFYCYAIFPQEYPQSKIKLEELLEKGIKSIGWDLSEILKIAEKENHPDYAQLVEFAKRISEE